MIILCNLIIILGFGHNNYNNIINYILNKFINLLIITYLHYVYITLKI